MSIRNPFRVLEKRNVSSVNTAPFIFSSSQGIVTPNQLVTADAALHNSDLYSVTSLVSADLAGSTFTGNERIVTILNKPTNLTSRYNFYQTIYLELMLSGNAFAVLERNRGVLTGLRYVPSSAVTLDLTQDKLTYIINSVGDWQGGVFEPTDVLHFKTMAYGNDVQALIGHSPLEALTYEYNQQESLKNLSLSVLTKGLNPTSVIKIPYVSLNTDAKEKVRSEVEKSQTGINSGRPLVLDNSIEFQQLDINANVADLITNDAYQRTQISKVFGIPTSYLNGKGDEQSNLEMIQSMYVNALNRYIEPITSEMKLKLDDSIDLDITSIIDYSGSGLKQDLLNYVDKGIITGAQAQEILISRGIIQL